MEVGTFDQFFSTSFLQYGHLAILTMCKQIWSETEPCGVMLRPSKGTMWTPCPAAPNDCSLKEIAITAYNSNLSYMINWCRIYLQIILVYDTMLMDRPEIHPSFIEGQRPPSRISNLVWPNVHRPPKTYWNMWKKFLFQHVKPYIQCIDGSFFCNANHYYSFPFYKHVSSHHL